MTARLLSLDDAATYCGVSRRHFDEVFASRLPVVDVAAPGAKRRQPRVDRADLDALIETMKQRGAA